MPADGLPQKRYDSSISSQFGVPATGSREARS